jgi:photosystem II stability/assembly factor-like uncharacterized protein
MKNFKKTGIVFCFLITILRLHGQTNINGGLISGTWFKANSPYLIKGSIEIPNNSTLTIEPGVEVIFQGYYKINVQGRILASGNSNDSIYFYPVDQATGWKGIRFLQTPNSNDTSRFEFCSIKYGKSSGSWPDDNGGALCLYDFSKVLIANSNISYNEASDGGAIFNYNAAPLVVNNKIQYNKANWNGGAIIGAGKYMNNNISFNQGVNCGGLYFFGSDTVANNIIANNISQNFGGGIFCGGGIFLNNIIANNEANNGGGIHFYPGDVLFLNNTIVNNKANFGGGFDMEQSAKPNLKNCIIWGNSGGQVYINGEGEDPNFYNCNLEGGISGISTNGYIYTGTNINTIDSDPLFIDGSQGNGHLYNGLIADWSLNFNSPCIDAGANYAESLDVDYKGNPRITVCKIDIGAIEFQSGEPFKTSLVINQEISCHDGSNGSVTVIATGGSGSYSYSWNTNDNSSSLSNLSAGKYIVTVTESVHNCVSKDSVVLINPDKLFVHAGVDQTLVCDGTIQLEATNKWDTLNYNDNLSSFESFQFVNNNVGFLVGTNSKLYKTVDGGNSWVNLNNSPITSINDVYFIDELTGFIIGYSGEGKIYKTVDGGLNWIEKNSNSLSYWEIEGNILDGFFVVGSNGTIVHSSDLGETWILSNTGTTTNLSDISVLGNGKLVATGENSLIIKSDDNGLNWSIVDHPLYISGNGFTSIAFNDNNYGVVGGWNGKALRTTDGGLTWNVLSFESDEQIKEVFVDENQNFYLIGYNVYKKSSNNGLSWTNHHVFENPIYFEKQNIKPDGTILLLANDMSNGSNYILKQIPLDIVNYSWSPSDGLSNPLVINPTVNIVSSKQYIFEASDNSGCLAKDTILISVIPIEIDLGQNFQIFCGMDTSIFVKSTNYNGVGELAYSWSPEIGLESTNQEIAIANPSASTNYFLTLNTPLGCSASDSIKIFVEQIYLNVGDDLSSFCGDSIQISNVYENSGNLANTTFSWSPSLGMNNPNLINPFVAPNDTTKYVLTLSTSNGCLAKDSLFINIIPFNVDAGSNITISCGSEIEIFANVSNFQGDGILNYSWSPEINISNTSISNPVVNPIQNQVYRVVVTSETGCSSSDEIEISITPLVLQFGADTTIVCGEKITLSDYLTNYSGPNPLIFSWSPTTNLDNSTVSNPVFYSNQSENLSLTIQTENGCTASDIYSIIVDALEISYNDINIECGTSFQAFFSSNYNGVEPLTFKWNTQSGLSDSTIAEPLITVFESTSYVITVETANNCVASDVFSVGFFPKDAPSICLVGVNDSYNEVVWNKFNLNSVDSFNIFRETNQTDIYEKIKSIDFEAFSVFVDSSSNPSVQSNKYRISLLDVCGQETSLGSPHKTIHLAINKGIGLNWNLIWEAYEGLSVSTYNIYRGTTSENLSLIGTSSASNTQYTDINAPEGDVYYQIELVYEAGCFPEKSYQNSFSNIASNTFVGIQSISKINNNLVVYPNPASSELNIVVDYFDDFSKYEMTNILGEIIEVFEIKSNHTILPISNLNKGCYFIRNILSGELVLFTKI